jgi:tmRNA-binding protein
MLMYLLIKVNYFYIIHLLHIIIIVGYIKHVEKCKRKLLMHKKEILKLSQEVNIKGFTLIPLSFYLNKGIIKVELRIS